MKTHIKKLNEWYGSEERDESEKVSIDISGEGHLTNEVINQIRILIGNMQGKIEVTHNGTSLTPKWQASGYRD